jgi:hypothetical protein
MKWDPPSLITILGTPNLENIIPSNILLEFITTPQPQNSDALSVGIGRYSDAPSVGIDLCRHLLAAAESGVAIAYADRHVFSDRLSDALGAIYTDT